MLMEKIMKMSKLAKKFTSVIIASALVFTLVNLPVVNADWVDNTSPQAAAVVGSYESFMPFAVTCDECCIGGCGYQDGVTIIQIIYGGRQNVQGPGFILFIVIPLPSGTITVPYFVSDPQDYESGAEITFPDIGVTIWLEFSGWGTLEEGDVLGDDSYVKYFPCECDYITCLCESCEATCIHVCEINHVICTGCNRCVPCDGCICTITVIKNWVGDDEHQDLRPDSVRIEVLEGGVYKDPRMFIYIEPDSNEIWYTVLEDLPQWRLYDDWYVSILYRFTVVENPVPPGYRSEVNGFVVTNTLLPRLDIDVTKEWVNDTNYLGFRPDDITVELRADGVAVETALLEGDDGWSYRWIDLPRYSAPGVPIVYTVVELDVPAGYTSTATATAPAQVVITPGELENSFIGAVTITNTFNREVVGFVYIDVIKEWENDTNHPGFRPDDITVELRADGVAVETALLEGDDGWSYRWTGLPRYSAPGVPIVYTVVELDVPAGYTSTAPSTAPAQVVITPGELENSYTGIVTITNTFNREVAGFVYIDVIKEWEDDTNHPGFRPDDITVELRADGVAVETALLEGDDGWSYRWTGLPRYSEPGVPIVYTVVELDVPAGYTSTAPSTAPAQVVITAGELEDSYTGIVTITNTFNREAAGFVYIDVIKEWENDTNHPGFRPDDITVELRADGVAVETALLEGADGWAYRWIDLPRYSAPGVPIVYTVVELDVPAGYTSTAPSTAPAQVVITAGELEYSFTGTVTITNTFNREAAGFVDIVVDKVWVGDEEHLGFRPDSVEVELLADGAPMDPPRVVVLTQLVENWRHTWTDLPEFSAPGVPIVYHVVELNVPDWYTEYVTWNLDRTAFTVTNTFYQGAAGNRAAIAVEKVWVNDEDHLGFRPDYVWVEIRREDRPAWSLPLRLRADEDWTCAWPEGLPRYFGPGEEDLIVYYVVEVDIPVGYSTPDRAEGDVYVGFTVTNTFDPGAVGDGVIEVTKLWVGDGNNIDRRPETIVVELRREDRPGVVVARAVMRADADGNWVHVFTRVPVYKADGVEIVYYVAEINPPPRYRPTYSGNQVDGFVITNTFQADPIAPETGDLLSTTSLAALLLALSSMLSGTFLMRKRRRGES